MKKTIENLYEALENIEFTTSEKALEAINEVAEQVTIEKSYGEWVIRATEWNIFRNEVAEIITADINEQADAEIANKADVLEILRLDTDWLLPDEYADIYYDTDALLDFLGYGYEQTDADDFRPCRWDD